MKKNYLCLLTFVLLCIHPEVLNAGIPEKQPLTNPAMNDPYEANPDYQDYLKFFEKVYDTMDKNYYYPVTRQRFNLFLLNFNKKIYAQLKTSGKSVDFIKWRSAAYMVDALKSSEDIFSAFMPPKSAKNYEKEVLGKKIDLGIEGNLTSDGYLVTKIEPRSDAYDKGLREQDLIQQIDKVNVQTLKPEEITDRLNPLENTSVALNYRDSLKKEMHDISVISKEYFKQTVFMIPVDVPGVECLQIQRFNRMTGDDMSRFMALIREKGTSKLIIDLRDNPGGPPLAAREIASFFLKPNEEFTYFKWKNKPNAALDVPEIPEQFRYTGDIVILVNKKSGSASELFTGIMQFRGRASVMGANTAGQVFLKSMFNFDDQSMLLLVTARGHKPDGTVFSFDGVAPDIQEKPDTDQLIHDAAEYLVSKTKKPAEKT